MSSPARRSTATGVTFHMRTALAGWRSSGFPHTPPPPSPRGEGFVSRAAPAPAVPRYVEAASDRGGASVPAAIELAIHSLHVRDLIVCGHSECAAMRAIASGKPPENAPHLRAWLRHGEPALEGLGAPPPGTPLHDHLSQRSVRLQIEHLRTYPVVREAEAAGSLRLHAWWFDIRRAEVLDYDSDSAAFVPLDAARVERLLARLG